MRRKLPCGYKLSNVADVAQPSLVSMGQSVKAGIMYFISDFILESCKNSKYLHINVNSKRL